MVRKYKQRKMDKNMGEKQWVGLCVIQWNAQSLIAHGLEFKNFLYKCQVKPDVICIQETFLKPSLKFKIPGYVIGRKDGNNGRGGVAICVRHGVSFTKFEFFEELEGMSVVVNTDRGVVEVINVYCSPTVNYNLEAMGRLFQKNNTVICGDFNAKSKLWGSPYVDKNGKLIESFLDETDMVVLNTGQNTHIHYRGESAIDLTFASPRLAAGADWEVLDKTFGSDHYGINIELQYRSVIEEVATKRWSFRKAKWDKFRVECDNALKRFVFSEDLDMDGDCDRVMELIKEVAEENIPKTRGRYEGKKANAFWSKECSDAVKKRERARRMVKSSRTPQDWDEYKRCKALATKVIKKAKRLKWRSYCSTINNTTKLGSVWKMVKGMNNTSKGEKIPALKVSEQEVVQDLDKANVMGKSFARVSSSENYMEKFKTHKIKFESDNEMLFHHKENDESVLNEKFKMSELEKALKRCKNTSPGKDQLCYEMFKHMSADSKNVILKLFNRVWGTGVVPKAWKHSVTIPVLKPGKPKNDPLSYRPIALTSNMGKLMERMIANRLNWFLEKNKILNVNQSGFRKKRSTLDQLIRLSDDILKALANKQYVLGVFLDIEKAYDMIWKKGLLFKVHQMGIGGSMFNWINSFLHNRTMQVRIGTTLSECFKVENGTPQGSVISPILFLLAINDINPPNVKTSMYADDTAVWCVGKNVPFLCKKVQESMEYLEEWCDKWGFKVSVAKTKVVLFYKGKKKKVDVKYRGVSLEQETKVKFLGMIFDKRMSWKDHIEYVVSKCKKKVNLLKVLSGTNWGASKEVNLLLYRSLIRSCIDYGCEVYDSCAKVHKVKLDRVQYQCLRICCGALRTTPVNALQVDCGEMPLQLRRLQLQCKAALKYRSNPGLPTNDCFQECWQEEYGTYEGSFRSIFAKTKEIMRNLPIANEEIVVENIPFWECDGGKLSTELSKVITKNDSPHVVLSYGREYLGKWNNHLRIYTDGSKSDDRTGCSFVIPALKIEFCARLSDNTSVFDAELIGILKAVQWVDGNPPFRCVILSDSLSAIQAICSDGKTSSLICEIRYNVYMLQSKGVEISFGWIPSHVGISGNEMADKAAKKALGHIRVDIGCIPEYSSVYNLVKKIILGQWQKMWDQSEKGRFYYNLVPVVSNEIKFMDDNRRKEVGISRVRFNHCLLNSTLHLMKRHGDGNCGYCMVKEDVAHFFLDCLEFQRFQQKIVSVMVNKCLVVNITNLLGSKSLVDLVWEYIRESKKVL